MYHRLLMLPMFNGLTTRELTQIIAQIQLDFCQHADGDTLLQQDDRCDRLVYVLSGQVSIELTDATLQFILTEQSERPFIVEPHNLYGMTQQYEHSYYALSNVDTVTVSKRDFSNVMLNFPIVRTNMLNLLCARIQSQTRQLHEAEAETVAQKTVQFIRRIASTPKGPKTLKIKMETLATLIQETRLNVSTTLHSLEQQGLISMPHRGQIHIPDMQALVKAQL
jgi:CRP-like cAMP-binding protein